MYQISFTFGLAGAVLFVNTAFAETPNDQGEVVKIPLHQIWANDMPGTRDIDKLDPKRPLAYEIRQAIGFPLGEKEADPGFAVLGTGITALREAHAIFVKGKQRRYTFPADSELSLVFFVYETRPFVHLQKVTRQGHNIKIYYRFVTHEEEVTTGYIALIPVGNLAVGKYQVDVNRMSGESLASRRISDFAASQIVCRSFSFTASK